MQEIFLTNENYVRSVTNIDNNIESKFLLSAIREAQEVYLQEVVGTALLDKLKALVADGTINDSGNTAYKALVDECQLFLAYQVISQVCIISAVKISNGGLQTNYDDNLNNVGLSDSFIVRDFYQSKADFFKSRLQAFIWKNRTNYPELSKSKCVDIKATLDSAATTALWLGGKRGK